MDIKQGKSYLTKQDLQEHSLWVVHEEDDLFYPVSGSNDLPEYLNLTDLNLRATFIAPNGLKFDGYIVGLKNIYCVVIFWNNEILYLNKNLFNDCIEMINKIDSSLKLHYKVESYFPLKYETTLDIPEFKNISGEFDIFKKRTEDERLGSY